MLLPNGSMIKQDVIESFNRAVNKPENIEQGAGTTGFWNFVESDMYIDLSSVYASSYIYECFGVLADDYEGVV